MRPSAVPAILLATLILSGCAASSGAEDVLTPVPSAETTNAITKPSGPIPAAVVGDAAPQSSAPQQPLSWTGQEPQALVPADGAVGMPMPTERPVAMLMPAEPGINPDGGPKSSTRSRIYGHRFRDAKPINFGRISPRKLAVHGVDVSRWQGEIDWETLRKQGANFVYIKATDGGDHLDPMFRKNWRRAKEAGLKHGAYHFFYWCRTGGEQADWFIRNVPKEANSLPPVIDVEWNGESSCKQRLSRKRVLEKMQVFMDKVERHYGQRPIIYTAPDFYRDNLKGELLNYPFWLRSVAAHPSKVYPGRKWVFWQYSGSGLSDGVDGKIDLNVFNGDESDWHDWVASR
ncbi:glycosyl hydrolase [Rhizobium leguminosarum bv. viciae]|uniref:GH25 family lysozyme n=1 Tax=Rhizobium leguminosarum TaxID=384 RepID=UPI000B8CDA8C|nr:GH25 family lysozyme [Rhizobium leguminosarum]ASR06246.1 glycosyl hydrolase [Rhizobium leguminosarum bv. viciae]